jgi:TonB-dependent receptor
LLEAEAATIEGRVSDAITGETMPGTTIYIKGTTLGATVNTEGFYSLKNVPAGDHVLIAHFLGYRDEEFKIATEGDLKYTKDFIMVSSSTNLTEFVVSERATGQVRTMNQQRDADNIKNIVSAEQIRSFPDLNAADALQRIPGVTLTRDQGEGRFVSLRGTPPELSNFNVNGIELPSPESSIRTVGMDVFNASQIQTIEVSKVLTPDMIGDAIGGSINLTTKRAESTTPEFNVVVAGGYNNLRNTPNAEGQFTFAQRTGRIGFLMNANYNRSIQGADNMEFKYEKGAFFGGSGPDNFGIQYTEVQLRHYEVDRKRVGLSTAFDFYINENNRIYLSGMYNNFSDLETRRRKVYTLDDATSERNYLYGGIEHDVKDRERIQNISTISLGFEHDLKLGNLKYEFSWSQATEDQPDRMEAVFENPGQAINIRFDMSNPDFPRATFPNPDNAALATAYDRYDLDKLIFENHEAVDRNLIGRLDYEIPYGKDKSKGVIKVGTLLRFKDKSRNITAKSYGAYNPQSTIYPIRGDTLNLLTVSDDFRTDNLLDEGFVMEAMPNPDLMREFFDRWPTLFIFGSQGITETLERSFTQDYTANENVQAYYAMVRHEFNDLMVLSGVRYERTDIDFQGFQMNKRSSGFYESLDTLTNSRTIEFWLPNIQFRYRVTPDFNVRGALTYSYSRPNFRDVVPYRVQAERNEVRLGNPDLEYPAAMNLDFLVEKYWGGRNIISGGLFYKRIDNFIFNYRVFGYEGDPTQANFNRLDIELPVNGQSAFVSGAEVQLQTFFTFMPGHWKNLGISTNYTYTHSEARINKRFPSNDNVNIVRIGEDFNQYFDSEDSEIITLPGQAANTLNLSLFYDSPKFYFKVSANYNEDFLSTLGADSDLDEYYGAQWRIDLNGYYQFNDMIQVFGDLRNATNAPLRFYLGPPDNRRILQTEFYSFWARLGVRLKF